MTLPLRGDVSSAINRVGHSLPDKALAQKEVRALLVEASEDTVLSQLIDATQNRPDPLAHTGAIRLILAIEPFPFDQLANRLANERESHRRTTLLWILHLGAKQDDEVARVLVLAKAELNNEEVGTYPHKAEDHTPLPLRACDVAHNILVSRMHPGSFEYQQISGDVGPSMRNSYVDRLCKELHLPAVEHKPIKAPTRKPYKLNWEVPPWSGVWLALLLALIALIGGGWMLARRMGRQSD